jgi:hydroxypyruvate isomerase
MKTLRQSVAEWCFFRNQPDPATYYRDLFDLGFAGVEVVDPSRYPLARAAGLHLVNATGTQKHGGLNRVEEHPEALGQIRRQLAVARERSIAQLIVFAGQRQGQPDELGIRNCIAGLKQVAAEAERAKVTLVFEVFNKFDHPDYQADYSDYAFQVVRAVASPSVKVLYDIYHMHRMGENVATVIAKNVSYISHLHVAGSPLRDFPGQSQEIDYRRVVQTVMAAGYDGLWGQEFVPQADPLAELAEVFTLFESYASPG